jgi:autotransporter-associated beta strand protein
LILSGVNPFAGGTDVTQGTLIVGDATHQGASLSGGGAVNVATGATLGGYGSVAGSVTNAGTIAVANAVPAYAGGPTGTFTVLGNLTNPGVVNLAALSIGNVLSVHGNYGSPGGTVTLAALLNGGGPLSNQSANRLLVLGSASGSTALQVHPSGTGAFTTVDIPSPTHGISLVQVAGTSSTTVFSLANGYVTGDTPYRYQLYAYGPGSPNGTAPRARALSATPVQLGLPAGERLSDAGTRTRTRTRAWSWPGTGPRSRSRTGASGGRPGSPRLHHRAAGAVQRRAAGP